MRLKSVIEDNFVKNRVANGLLCNSYWLLKQSRNYSFCLHICDVFLPIWPPLLLSVWGQGIIYFSKFVVLKRIFLKGMDATFLLSKDERLTPDIGKVMVVYVI